MHRKWSGALGQVIIRSLVVGGFHDTQCGFKLLQRDHALTLFQHQRIHGFGFDFEMLFLARRFGYPIIEIPIICRHQEESSVRLGSYFAVLLEVGKLLWHRLLNHYPKQGHIQDSRRGGHRPSGAD